jgi:hypothetical protein
MNDLSIRARFAPLSLLALLGLSLACNDAQKGSLFEHSELPIDSTLIVPGPHVSMLSAAASGVGCTNEPAGYTAFTNQPFSGVPPMAPKVDGYGWKNYTSVPARLTSVTDVAPGSPSTAIRGKFPQGLRGGTGPFNLNYRFPKNVTRFYSCVWHKLSSNFTNNGNTGTKFAFIETPYTSYTSGLLGLSHYFNLTTLLGLNLSSHNTQLNRNMRSSWITTAHGNQWHRFEWLVVANTPGAKNGIARIWVDGNLLMDYTDVEYFFSSQTPKFTGLKWNPTYGGGTNPVPYDMFEWVDNWYVSAP